MISLPLLVALAAAAPTPQDQDWPRYRGPHLDAAVEYSGNWSATGATRPLWTKEVGRGYSGPSIADDRLVTLGYDEAAGQDRIVCLDRVTGAQLWRFDFASGDKPQFHGGGTLTTPTIHEGRVYCSNRDGRMHVLDLASGTLVWSRDYKTELELERTFHGFASSPYVRDGRIFLLFGGVLAAVQAVDGEPVWKSKDYGDGGYGNPTPLRVGGTDMLGVVLGSAFHLFRQDDGTMAQQYPWKMMGGGVHCAMPLPIGDDRVFVSSAYNKGCALLDLHPDKAPERVWSNKRMRTKVTGCVLYDDHLFGFDESMLRCLDLDGKSKWRVRGLGMGSLSRVGDRLLVLSSDGELIVGEARSDEFRELSRRKVFDDGECWTIPVFVDGRIYVRNSLGTLCCLDHRASTGAAETDAPDSGDAPAATDLFAAHAERADPSRFRRPGRALELRGTWTITSLVSGAAEMTWTLAEPNLWEQRREELRYATDGRIAWSYTFGEPRLLEGEELFDCQRVFRLPELFSPACPDGATTEPRPVQFAETRCWAVRSKLDGRDCAHYFAVEDGRYVGTDGDGLSTLEFEDWQQLDDLHLPKIITRYAVADGEKQVLAVTSATWITRPDALFALPAAVQRLMRTPAEIARDTAALQKRFGPALGRYQGDEEGRKVVTTLIVRDGELWWSQPYGESRFMVETERDGEFRMEGASFSVRIVRDGKQNVTNLEIRRVDGKKVSLARQQD